MKNLKRVLSAALSAAMLMALAACGGGNSASSSAGSVSGSASGSGEGETVYRYLDADGDTRQTLKDFMMELTQQLPN